MMCAGYEITGVLDRAELDPILPSIETLRRRSAGVAVTECVQNIPCNPCVSACPFNAISMAKITDNPEVDFERCVGCRTCLHKCPGLAIFYMAIKDDRGIVGLPYELRPLPQKGDKVVLLDRAGMEVGKGEVIGVEITERDDRTAVVLLDVGPVENVYVVRHFKPVG